MIGVKRRLSDVARIAKGFGMNVIAYDAYCPAEVIEAAGVTAVGNQTELFEKADIVSLHIPATPETKQSINRELVGKMKKGGILINTARKEVIDEAGLVQLFYGCRVWCTNIKSGAGGILAQ